MGPIYVQGGMILVFFSTRSRACFVLHGGQEDDPLDYEDDEQLGTIKRDICVRN